jgi:hypothetical protein
MSRILKRPMFRRGGPTNTGIMSGIVDRTKHATDPFVTGVGQRASKIIPEIETLLEQYTPETRLPIGEFGLDIASGTPIIQALKTGYGKFTKADDAREAAIKSGAAKIGLQVATTTPKDARTAAIKNAMAMGLIPGSKEFNEYVTAATIKAGGLNIEFNEDGTIKSISEGTTGKNDRIKDAQNLQIQTFQMNNAAKNLVSNLEGSKTGFVGFTITALDNLGAQFEQAADSFGFKKFYRDTGSGDIDSYLEKTIGSSIAKDSVQYAKIKSVSINLAYLMARIDEPGGRFTDRDIALKMEEIGIGSNPQRTIEVLKNAVQLRNENAAFAYRTMTGGKELDFSGIDVVGSTGKKEDVYKIIDGVMHIEKDGKFIPFKVQ